MKTTRIEFFFALLYRCLLAEALVGAITMLLLLIGRGTLGEGVIALLYLVPIVWITLRWGQLPGISTALVSALLFDYFFIPPFDTFAVGGLEGWLVLFIFLGVAVVVVNRLQSGLSKVKETIFMYELSSALAVARSSDAVARIVTKYIQQLWQVRQVRVVFQAEGSLPQIAVVESQAEELTDHPDRILPVINDKGLVGEIQVWHDSIWSPLPEDPALLQNFAFQAGRVLGRTRQAELEGALKKAAPAAARKR